MKKAVSKKKVLGGLFLFFMFSILMVELVRFVSCYFYVRNVTQNETQVMRIMLFGSSDNPEGETVSAKISVLDSNGSEVAIIERSWPEPYLAVDFRSASFLGKNFYFPDLIYGTVSVTSHKSFIQRRRSGTVLDRYYVEHEKCLLGTNRYQKKALFNIFSFSLNKNTVNLSSCENGIYYGVFNEGGKLVLRQE